MERFPSAEMRRRLAEDFEVEPRQVQFWFQARAPARGERKGEEGRGPAEARVRVI